MIREFKLPDVGEGVAEGELVSWLVEPGDPVSEDQPVAEVETDKALVEIPSPYDGTVAELRAEEGEMVPVGEVIITFEIEGEAATDAEGESPSEAEPDAESAETSEASETTESTTESTAQERGGRVFAPPSVRRLARELGVDLAAVAGSGPGGRLTESDVRAAAAGTDGERESESESEDGATETPTPRSVSGGTSVVSRRETAATDSAPTSVDAAGRERTLAAPATRRVADELGVDLDDVPSSEVRDGEAYVTEADVRAYAERQEAARSAEVAEPVSASPSEERSPAEAAETTETRATTAQGEGPSAGERVPYRGVRRAIGEQMERSKYTAPHVTHHDEVDVNDLVDVRADLKERTDARLTYMPFVMKAVVRALQEYPSMNASLDEEAEEIVLHDRYNVGVAVATDAGLMVPVVDDVDRKSLVELAREVGDLADRARDRSITRSEMQGGTFTVTNVGAIGGEYATPIINYPEVGILALGALKQRPWVDDGEVVARHTLPLSLSIDHRVVDGAIAARFTNRVAELLSAPHLLLLE